MSGQRRTPRVQQQTEFFDISQKDDQLTKDAALNVIKRLKKLVHEYTTTSSKNEQLLKYIKREVQNLRGYSIPSDIRKKMEDIPELASLLKNEPVHTSKRTAEGLRVVPGKNNLEQKYSKIDRHFEQYLLSNKWEPWQLKVIASETYQQMVKNYISDNKFSFVNLPKPPSSTNGFLVLFSHTEAQEYRDDDLIDFDIQAINWFMKHHKDMPIPCLIKFTKKNLEGDLSFEKDDVPQYALCIDWNLEMIKGLKIYKTTENEKILRERYEIRKNIGFRSYEFKTKNTLDQIKSHIIDPVEQIGKCKYSPKFENINIPSPGFFMKDTYVLKLYQLMDTMHDFAATKFQQNFLTDVVFKGIDKDVNIYYQFMNRMENKYNPSNTFDAENIAYITEFFINKGNKGHPLVKFDIHNVSSLQKYATLVTDKELNDLSPEKKQLVLNSLAHNHENAKAFINYGARNTIFDTTQQAFCGATRLEGTTMGTYIDNDSGYGYDKDELMYFDKVYVHDGNVYVEKSEKFTKLPFLSECVPYKMDVTSVHATNWINKCLCKLPSSDTKDIACALYDLKRIADGLVFKAALHHHGVFVSHDNLAILGARLYGCPVISYRTGNITMIPSGAVFDDNVVLRNNQNINHIVITPVAKHVGEVNATHKGVYETTKKRQREPETNEQYETVKRQKPDSSIWQFFKYFTFASWNMTQLPISSRSISGGSTSFTKGGSEDHPSDMLIGCLIEFLVFKNNEPSNILPNGTFKHDYVVKALHEAYKMMRNNLAIPAMNFTKMESAMIKLIQHMYAERFGIRNCADHAIRVFLDPALNQGYRIDRKYQAHIRSVMKTFKPVSVPKPQSAIASVPKPQSAVAVSATTSKEYSVAKSAPTPRASSSKRTVLRSAKSANDEPNRMGVKNTTRITVNVRKSPADSLQSQVPVQLKNEIHVTTK